MKIRPDTYRKLSFLLVLLLILTGAVTYRLAEVSGMIAPSNTKIVEIDLKSGYEIKPVIIDRKVGRIQTFSEIVGKLKPYAAINGTFYARNLQPLGDIVIDSKLVNGGRYTNAIAMRKDGKVEFIRRSSKEKFDWSGYKAALAAGPRLICDGKINLTPIPDGFSKLSLEIKAQRSGVGLTKSGKLLLVVAKDDVTLKQFAQIMQNLGCVEAMNLDGGPACALYCDGKTVVKPTLIMTNLLLVYRKTP